ncbi:S-adenosyl-L-methionine-dependent methyltransferase [Apodospora peruviana]|uniref:S-adenosyl-L-methionine-dependent methyltransferase n=1 Tax=Apodospora peruviana TaxID=516989 RepID=A0AAE0IHF6_9PEZI|nr:S-adenosyl-L-methionine-dependent methyltransferase [Apodospora peruviana]
MSTKNFQFPHVGETRDQTWTAVDAYAMPHSHPSSRPNTAALENALLASKAAGLPDISASPAQAKFMALTCRMLSVTHALEVGTLGGYSAIWLASENPQLHLVTVEYDPHHAEVARKNIEFAGLTDRIEVIEGAGVDVLAKLKEEVLAGKRERFSFTFIDADKENNWNYFDMAADMSKPNTPICVDNVVRGGKLVDFSNQDSRILGAREVIEKAGKDPRVDSVVIQTVGEKSYDGCLWAVLN